MFGNDTCKDWSPKLWSIFLSVFFKNSLISIGSYFPWRVMIRNPRWRKQVSSFSTDLQALGMENGDIPNENINGSTSLSGYEAWKGRLNGKSCWRPAQNLDGEYITVTFASKKTVIAIATQGSPDDKFWVQRFTYQYFADASLKDPNKVKSTNIGCTGQGRPEKIFLSVTMKHKHFRMMMILKFQSLLLSRTFSMRVCDSRFFWRRQICEINVSQKFPMIRYLISKSFRPCFRPPLICGAQPMIRCAAVKFSFCLNSDTVNVLYVHRYTKLTRTTLQFLYTSSHQLSKMSSGSEFIHENGTIIWHWGWRCTDTEHFKKEGSH